jgi:hypothetical protein
MAYKKGQSGNPAGKPAGTPNRATRAAREAIAAFVDGNAEKLSQWLDEIYLADGPKAAFNCFTDLVEFHVPKLARTEVTAEVEHSGEVGIRPQLTREQWLALHKAK